MSRNLIFNLNDLSNGTGTFSSNYKEYNLNDFFDLTEEIEEGDEIYLFLEPYKFKKNDIDKNLTGFQENLYFSKVIYEKDTKSIYQFDAENYSWLTKIDTTFSKNNNENTINLCLNLIQSSINSFRKGIPLFFNPTILDGQIFYNKENYYGFMFSQLVGKTDDFISSYKKPLPIDDDPIKYSQVNRISLIISMIYNISSKLFFLQKNLNFNHNDLTIYNIVWTSRPSGGLDFFFIDFEMSRIKTNESVIAGENFFGQQDKLVEGKDMYCLIHSIIAILKKDKYNNEKESLEDFFSRLGLKINDDFINIEDMIYELPENKQEEFRKNYGSSPDYIDNMTPYFLSYLLDEYPENYYTDRIISNLDKYLDTKVWDNHYGFPLIDEETLKLAKKYQNLANYFRINGDFTNDSSIKGNYEISLKYIPKKLDLSRDDSGKDDSGKDDSTKDDSKNKRKYLINRINKIDSNSVKTDYYKKYLKYKNKYLTLKKQFGGTKEEGNNYLLHGTSLFYIDDIKKNGLSGFYNQEIYNIIIKYWHIISYLAKEPYVGYFINRQKDIRSTGQVSLSFTGQSSVAEEYSRGVRKFGEGPRFFLRTLKEYFSQNKEIPEDMIRDKNVLEEAEKYPGIILAIDKNDFEDTKNLPIERLDSWELVLNFPIPADKLYIRKDKNDYIKLLSEEGILYIDKLKSDFLEKERLIREETERIKLLEGWETETRDGPIYFSYKTQKKNGTILLQAVYDTYSEDEYPHYLQLTINNYSDININIVIRNILGTKNYEMETNSFIGYDLIISNSELKEKLKEVIDGVMNFIPEDRKEKILEKLIEKLS